MANKTIPTIQTNEGNVGIGTTNPIASLEVDNSAASLPVLNLGGGEAGNAVSDLYILNSYNNNTGVGYAAKVIGVNISGSLTNQNIPIQRTVWGGVTSATAIVLGTDGPRAGTQDNAFQIWTTNDGVAGTALTQKFSVTSAGDVGIGTVAPAQKLDVNGAIIVGINNSYGAYSRTLGGVLKPWFATASTNTIFYNTNTSGLIFWQNSADTATLMSLSEQGRLGINTNDPSGRLHVLDTALYPPSLTWNAAAATIIRSENGQMAFGSDDTAPYGIWQQVRTSSSTARPLLLNPLGGNVGVGIRNPSATLDVAGAIRVTGVGQIGPAGALGFAVYNDRTNNLAGQIYGRANGLQFTDNVGINSVYIASGGKVGIGVTTPTARLQVSDTGDIPYIILNTSSTADKRVRLQFTKTGNAGMELGTDYGNNNGNNFYMYDRVNGTTFGVFSSNSTWFNANVGIGTTAPSSLLHLSATGTTELRITSTTSNTNSLLSFYEVGLSSWGIEAGQANGTFFIKDLYNTRSVLTLTSLGRVGICTTSPTTLLSIGGAGSTTAASGITFGGDAQANLYRTEEDTLRTDGALIAGTYLRALNYVQLLTNLYPDSYTDYLKLNVGNAAGNAWENYPVVIKRGVYVGIGTDTPTGKLHVVSSVAGETVLRADGTNGTLFSVVDNLSDSLMSVNNSAGLPVLEVFADDRVVMGQYSSGDLVVRNNKVGIGTTNPTNKLSVIGNASIGSSTYNTAAPTNGLIVEGNVGIGSTSPAYKLDCYSTNGVAEVARFYNNQTACNFSVGSTANTLYSNYLLYTSSGNAQFFKNRSSTDWGGADSLNIYTSNGAIAFHPANTANRVYFATDGNVGIGVSTPAQKLDVKGYVLSDLNSNAVAGGFFVGNASYGIRRDAGSNDVRLHTNGGDLIFGAAGSGSQQVTLKNGGNVGIGSINPSYKLEVYSAAKTSEFVGLSISNFNNYDGTAASLVTSQLRFAILETPTDTYNAPSRTFATCQAGNEANNSSSDGFFAISTRSSAVVAEKFRITSAGNVGIGTTNPGYRLDVTGGDINFAGNSILRFGTVAVLNGSSNANDIYANIRVIRNRSSTLNDGMYVNYDSLGTTAAHLRFYANGATERMRIDASNGHVGIGTASPAGRLDVYDSGDAGHVAFVRNLSSGINAYSALVLRRDGNNNGLVFFTNSSNRSTDGGLGNSTIRTDNGKLLLGAGASTYHSLETNGNVGIGLTNPSAARLHVKGDGTNPVLRVETALLVAGTTTSSKTFVGWMPIQTGAANPGDTVFIPLFK